ncbi:hypothetical protein ACH427_04270 [Streptomyces sp. NPDC020379]|uniref:phage tail fiber protein n=1 Tax=Streptomyces sp. NPDC020379 TaxID=3365071 RepID=UPI003789FF5B
MVQSVTPGLRDLWMQALMHPQADVPEARVRQWYETASLRLATAAHGDGSTWLGCLSSQVLSQLSARFAQAPEALNNFISGSRAGSCWVMLLTRAPLDPWATGEALARDYEVAAEGCSPQRVLFADGVQTNATDGTIMVSNSNTLLFGPFTGTAGSGGTIRHVALLPDPVRGDTVPIAVGELDIPVTATQGSTLVIPKGAVTLRTAPTGPVTSTAREALLQASLDVTGKAETLTPLLRHMSAYLAARSPDTLLLAVHDDIVRWLASTLTADSQYLTRLLAARGTGQDFTADTWIRLLTQSPGTSPTMSAVLDAELLAPGYLPQLLTMSAASSGHELSNRQRVTFGTFTDLDGTPAPVTHIAVTSNRATGHVIAVWPLDAPVQVRQFEDLTIPEKTLSLECV